MNALISDSHVRFTMNDHHAQAAISGMCFDSEAESENRADVGQLLPKISVPSPWLSSLKTACSTRKRRTERAGFDLPSFCKIVHRLCLQFNSSYDKDLESLVDLLYTHDFLLSRDLF